MRRLGSTALLLTFAVAGYAYNPPVDTAGPLTVRIHDPSLGSYGAGGLVQLTRPGIEMVVEMTLSNAANAPLTGTVRLGVIDGWKVEPSMAEFRAPARQSIELLFQVTAASKLYNADYPIHAYAEFDHEGRNYIAHPILIMEGRLANPPRGELPVEWKPVPVPVNGALGLQRLPVHREVSTCASVGTPVAADEMFQSAPAVAFDRSVRRGELRHAIATGDSGTAIFRVLVAPFVKPGAGYTLFERTVDKPDGEPKKAWFRAEFKAQSYRFRPDRLTPFVERNLGLIRDHLHPTAYFIDVWSSMAPYDYWTPDGRYVSGLATRDTWRETFEWIRNFLGDDAPQISEAGHDQLIGWLDGAQLCYQANGDTETAIRYFLTAIKLVEKDHPD